MVYRLRRAPSGNTASIRILHDNVFAASLAVGLERRLENKHVNKHTAENRTKNVSEKNKHFVCLFVCFILIYFNNETSHTDRHTDSIHIGPARRQHHCTDCLHSLIPFTTTTKKEHLQAR